MASTTANLGLTLPAVSDPADIGALNENFKKIDALGGYGLGGSAVSVNDLNTALNCGFFCWSSDCLNAPFGYGMGITINRFNGRYTQLLFNPWMGSYGEIVVRHYNGTEWIPVEWVNPPMSLGVEYRTTERWNGSAVYCKAVEFGLLPNTSYKAVNHGIDSYKKCVRYEIVNSYSTRMLRGDRSVTQVDVGSSNIQITTSTDMSNHNAVVILWYTKQ